MNRTPESTDVVGVCVGALLRERGAAVAAPSIQMERVVAGASRRRRRSRIGASSMCVALVVGAGFLVTQRIRQAEPALPPVVADRLVLGLYPVLDGYEPREAFAGAGAAGLGSEYPQTDVWAAQSQRLVIRTVTESQGQVETLTTMDVPTPSDHVTDEGPWSYRTVDRTEIRGVVGAVEMLAPDQYSVWIPTGVADRYTQVIGRGLSREATLSAVEAMVEVDGVLQPADPFVRVEHADSLPVAGPSAPFAKLDYGPSGPGEGPWVTAFAPEEGRSTLELAMWSANGRLEMIDGRQVLLTEFDDEESWATWLDASGLIVSVGSKLPHVEELISSVRMVQEAEFVDLAAGISNRIVARTNVVKAISFGETSVTRRTGTDGAVLCVIAYGSTACLSEQTSEEVEISNMHTEIDGHWLMFGYREIGDQDPATIRPAELRFESLDGVPCIVHVTESDGGYWYVVEVPDGVNVVTTNVGDIFGGPVGDISRPQVASVY